MRTDIDRDRARLDELVARQEKLFVDRHPVSARLTAECGNTLVGAATSSWQMARPGIVWIDRAVG